jgi:hypothetical protein
MSEEFEASLSWPQTGLIGVPTPANGVAESSAYPPATRTAPAAPAAPAAPSTNGGNGNGHPLTEGPDRDQLADPGLHQAIASVSLLAREVSGTLRAMPEGVSTDAASDALRRLEDAAALVTAKLNAISLKLDQKQNGLSAKLAFGTAPIPSVDPSLPTTSAFEGGIPGITTESGVGTRHAGSTAVTWPPWSPPRKVSMWSRVIRSNIAIPLLLVAVIAIAGATYKIVQHESAISSPPTPSVSAAGIKSYGSVKVISGPTCKAGSSTATVQLAAAQAKDGSYFVSAVGTMSNGAAKELRQVVVHWTVTYADGYSSTQSVPIDAGGALPGQSSKSFYSVATHSEGSVPPASVAITSIQAVPAQPACS